VNGRGHKKERKDRKGNRIHGKDKEGTRRGRGSPEESTGGNKEVSRQGEKRKQSLEEGRQSTVEYQRLGVQRKAGKEIDRLICGSIYNRGGGVHKYSQAVITNLYKNLSSDEHQSDSMIQGTDGGTEKGGS